MGGKNSGNREWREKKSAEDKSRVFQCRLHPDNPDEAWCMAELDGIMERENKTLRKLMPDLVAAYLQMPLQSRSMVVGAEDVITIQRALHWIVDQLQNGISVGNVKTERRKKIAIPDVVHNTVQRFLDTGFTGED